MSRIKKIFYISILIITFLLIVFSCAVSELMDIVKNPTQIQKPKWDLEFNVPVIEKTISVDELLKKTVDIEKMIKEKMPDADFKELSDGRYQIEYKINFPDIDSFANSDVTSDLNSTFATDLFNYTTPSFPVSVWPLPVQITNPAQVLTDTGYFTYNLGSLGATFDLEIDLEPEKQIPPKPATINKDLNADNSNDLLLKGISAPNGKIYLTFTLLKNTISQAVLANGDIDISKFNIEGNNLNFSLDLAKTTFTNGLTNELVLSAPIPAPLYFDGDNTLSNFRYFDIKELEIKIKALDYTTFNLLNFPLPDISPTPKMPYSLGGTLNLKLEAKVDLGDKVYILCKLYPITFDMGITNFSEITNLTSFFNKSVTDATDEMTKLQNKLTSSFSVENMTMNLDVTNDLPFSIDLTKMFNPKDKTNYKNLPGQSGFNNTLDPIPDNTLPKYQWDGGLISYFDMNADINKIPDDYQVLSPTLVNDAPPTSESFLINGNTYSSKKLQNIGGFLQQPNSLTNPTKNIIADKIYFTKVIDVAGSSNDISLDVSIFSKPNLVKLNTSITVPMALKFYDTTDDIDVLKALMNPPKLPITSDITKQIPIGDIDTLNINMDIENRFPFGVTFTFDLIAEPNDAANIKTVSLLLGNSAVTINSGDISTTPDGLYYASGSKTSNLVLGVNKNFNYIDNTGTTKTFDGDLIKFINDSKEIYMSLKINLKQNAIDKPIIITNNDFLKAKVNIYGKTKIDLGALIK